MIDRYMEQRIPFPSADLPEYPPAGVMWVFMEGETAEAVEFLCPCGCGKSIYTPLHAPHPQRWAYQRGPNGPTITPSIRWTAGCKAHFNITDGQVVWHSDSGK